MEENVIFKIAKHCVKYMAGEDVCEECPAYSGSDMMCREAARYTLSIFEEIEKYRSIGTVAECREAREKQEPKKPEALDKDFDYYKCPVCGEYIWATDNINDHNYCLNCGQAIEWEESEEE